MPNPIAILQKPLAITPSNTNHIWTLSAATLGTNFKLVMDIYFSPNNLNQKKARLIASPNEYNVAMFDAVEIVRNFLEPNPRAIIASANQLYPSANTASFVNTIVTNVNATKTHNYNAYNQFYSTSIPDLWQIEEYGVKVGCTYTSGSTTVLDISTGATWQPDAVLIFPGVDNNLIPQPNLTNAKLYSGYTGSSNFYTELGQNHYYYDLFRHVYSGGTPSNDCSPKEFLNAAGPEKYPFATLDAVPSGTTDGTCRIYIVRTDFQDEGLSCGEIALNGNARGVWGKYTSFNGEIGSQYFKFLADCQTNTTSDFEHELKWTRNGICYDVTSGGTITSNTNYTFDGPPQTVVAECRTRKHHRECPIIVSFLNGKNDLFTNDIYSIGIWGASGSTYEYKAESLNRNSSSIPTVKEGVDSTFRMLTFYTPYNYTNSGINIIPTDVSRVAFFGTSYSADIGNRLNPASATTEILEFIFEGADCRNEPQHFLFMNGRGMWDTITLDKKSQKTINVQRETYFQGQDLSRSSYSSASYNRGKRVYDTQASYEVLATSWYITQNDMIIYEELFMSPDVYLIKGTDIINYDCAENDELLFQYLIPVVMKDKSFVEYNRNYQKLYQYQFTFEYAGGKRFRTQG